MCISSLSACYVVASDLPLLKDLVPLGVVITGELYLS